MIFIKNPKSKKNLAGGRGGGDGVAWVSDFSSKESTSDFFSRDDWLVKRICFIKNPRGVRGWGEG